WWPQPATWCSAGGPLNWPEAPMIPLVDVKAQYAPLIPELKERFSDVLDSGRFILGPNVSAFEEEAAAYLGVPAAVGVANGTDALVLVLDAMGIGAGDEVICPAFTFYATKNLFGLGAGGLVAATDEELADRVRLLRFHGSRDKVDFELIGYNSRLDELQAAALRVFLPHLDGWNRGRREAAARYAE